MMKTGCGYQALVLVPMKALRFGLTTEAFTVLTQLLARPKKNGISCITYNELSWCFMPRFDRTQKALAELERYGILKILRRVPEGFLFEIRSENEWRFVLPKRLRKTNKTANETTGGEKEETAA